MSTVIAVWGNQGVGKSMLACALGNQLTKRGGNVIIISGDKVTPMLGVYLPFIEDKKSFSISEVLTSSSVSKELLKNKIHIHSSNSRLGFLGLIPGENGVTHQLPWNISAISSLLGFVADEGYADYIIFDCCVDILSDNVTIYALEHANTVFNVISADTRGVSFLRSQMPIIRSGSFGMDKFINILGNAYSYSPIEQMKKDYNIEYVLPNCRDVYTKYVSGSLINNLFGSEGITFERELCKIAERVLDGRNNK